VAIDESSTRRQDHREPRPRVEWNDFLHRFVGDLGAAVHAANVVVGDELGLYKALAGAGLTTPTALADEQSPAFVPGVFQLACAGVCDMPMVVEAFRAGGGIGRQEHNHGASTGCERCFRPGHAANLTRYWIPALDGVQARLETGARVVDVGCGCGASTILMAQAFPASTFVGFDRHDASIEEARERAAEAGVTDRCRFEVASAKDYPAGGYDLVTTFDGLRDMGDPLGAAEHVLASLAPDGTCCWWSPPRVTGWRTTSPLSAARTTGSRHCCASPARCRRRSASRSVRRRGRPASPPWWRPPGSPGSESPPPPRSTSSSRPDPDPRWVVA
jgi:SAM-dependent methyltransferase